MSEFFSEIQNSLNTGFQENQVSAVTTFLNIYVEDLTEVTMIMALNNLRISLEATEEYPLTIGEKQAILNKVDEINYYADFFESDEFNDIIDKLKSISKLQ